MGKSSIAVLLLFAAALSFAQAPKPSLHTTSSDLFAGLVGGRANYTNDFDHFFGYEGAYTLHLTARWGVTVAVGQSFAPAQNADQWQITAGPRFNFLTGRFRPYVTAQFGFSNQDADRLHPGVAEPVKFSLQNALTARGAAGADLQLTHRLYWRILQFNEQAVPWGRPGHGYSRFENASTGIGIDF